MDNDVLPIIHFDMVQKPQILLYSLIEKWDADWADLTDKRRFSFFVIRVYPPNPCAKHPRSIFCVKLCNNTVKHNLGLLNHVRIDNG